MMSTQITSFLNSFKSQLKVISPGRINFIGEHTDYNNGFVLPTAIDKKITLSFQKASSATQCTVLSTTYQALFTFDIDKVEIREATWENFIVGVVAEIQKITNGIGAFDCLIDSDLPLGSGVSSSAALECGIAYGLNALFELNVSTLQMVQLSQRAEHNFVGTKCGIMDQYAVMKSKESTVLLLDCLTNQHTYIDVDFDPYVVLLLNTNVSHNLASSEYNTRREECEEVVSMMQKDNANITSLRDITLLQLKDYESQLSDVHFQRATYVLQENQRVLEAVDYLKEGNLKQFGNLMYASHFGLQHQYEVSCPELDFLVDFSKGYDQVLGARMMGGGFGGCTINLIHKNAVEKFITDASIAYKKEFDIDLTSFVTVPSQGTSIYS
ncbi:galactokinase [uncultured Dokdonia sp.]|uniref:galactokinase n=1 Tax=uncultured Dokdonia sp. TaxID=575653 RepID=UPI00261C4D61|nr:galactokinase [uncultured Dokdonia sp.]